MKTILNLAFIACINAAMFTSCTKEQSLPLSSSSPCQPCNGTPENDINLIYPGFASPGEQIIIRTYINGNKSYPVIIKWYANDFQYPQSLSQVDTLTANTENTYQFKYPVIQSKIYYIRCNVTIMGEPISKERTISIRSL